jgi:DNA polymerase III epsilon subunit-like protein
MFGRGIVVDTETSGLFDFKRSADADGQPRLAQLAMIMIDEAGEIESEHAYYVQPDGWTMDPQATEKNGLTDGFLREHGIPVRDVLEAYSAAILSGRYLVAFNAQHDAKVMRGELRRAGMPDLFEETRNVCVMRKANGIILKDGGKKGWPSLARCREVLGLSSEGAHGAVKDAMDALAVYRHLRAQGVDLAPEVHHHAHVEEIRTNG